MTAKVSSENLEMFWKKTNFETEHLSRLIIRVDIRKKNMLNLILTNPELFELSTELSTELATISSDFVFWNYC